MGVASSAIPVGLRIAVSEQGTTSTVELEGEWDLAEDEHARAAVGRALERGPQCLVLDLSAVSFIDSSAVHIVVRAASRCRDANVHMVVIPGPPQVHRVFEICQLTEMLAFTSRT